MYNSLQGILINLTIGDEEYKKFREYYVKSRKLDQEAVKKGISILSGDINENARLWKIAQDELGKSTVSAFGEACVSYYLEKKLGIILTHAGWKDSPFTISQGVDLIGGNVSDFSSITIIYVEVKTCRTSTHKDLTLKKLKNQLILNRIEGKFNLSVGDYSYIGFTSRLLKYIRENNIISEDGVKFKEDYFERLGAVVAKESQPWQSIMTLADPGDSSSNRPCKLLLLILEELETRFKELFAIETFVDEYMGAP